MKAPFHYAELSVFSLATEDVEKVRKALLFIAGAQELKVKTEEALGYHKNPITILSVKLEKNALISDMFNRMAPQGLCRDVLSQLEERFDDELVLNIRFNKQEAFKERLVLASENSRGGVVSVRAKAEAYPKKRENGLKAVREFLEGLE